MIHPHRHSLKLTSRMKTHVMIQLDSCFTVTRYNDVCGRKRKKEKKKRENKEREKTREQRNEEGRKEWKCLPYRERNGLQVCSIWFLTVRAEFQVFKNVRARVFLCACTDQWITTYRGCTFQHTKMHTHTHVLNACHVNGITTVLRASSSLL